MEKIKNLRAFKVSEVSQTLKVYVVIITQQHEIVNNEVKLRIDRQKCNRDQKAILGESLARLDQDFFWKKGGREERAWNK